MSADDATGAITIEPIGLVLSEEAASDLADHPERVAEMLSRARTVTNAKSVTIDDLFEGI